MILLIDNYDSFTWNLANLMRSLDQEVWVVRNDQVSLEEVENMRPEGIMLSPGPGRPHESGICPSVVQSFHQRIPIFGICLGHQLIGELMGGKVVHAEQPMHGRTSEVFHDGKGLFKGVPNPFQAMRYHSLVLEAEGLSPDLIVSAATREGAIMAIRHRLYPLKGVQFHPESILTPDGSLILENWLEEICRPVKMGVNKRKGMAGRRLSKTSGLEILTER